MQGSRTWSWPLLTAKAGWFSRCCCCSACLSLKKVRLRRHMLRSWRCQRLVWCSCGWLAPLPALLPAPSAYDWLEGSLRLCGWFQAQAGEPVCLCLLLVGLMGRWADPWQVLRSIVGLARASCMACRSACCRQTGCQGGCATGGDRVLAQAGLCRRCLSTSSLRLMQHRPTRAVWLAHGCAGQHAQRWWRP